jgi:hypothetical protein
MEGRVAVLEANIGFLKEEITEVRKDVRELRGDISGLRAQDEKNFRLLFGSLIAMALGLGGLMSASPASWPKASTGFELATEARIGVVTVPSI